MASVKGYSLGRDLVKSFTQLISARWGLFKSFSNYNLQVCFRILCGSMVLELPMPALELKAKVTKVLPPEDGRLEYLSARKGFSSVFWANLF